MIDDLPAAGDVSNHRTHRTPLLDREIDDRF